MIDLILLIFLCRHIGNIARSKGLPARKWIFYTVLTWLGFELIGLLIGVMLFGFNKSDEKSLYGLMAFAMACGFGGYLLVKSTLDKKPDSMDDEINNIGNTG